MKKFIALIACLVLVVYAGVNSGVFSLEVNDFGMNVSIEAGNNEVKKVQTVEELSDVLQNLVARLTGDSTSTASVSNETGALAALADEDGDTQKVEYTDAILTFQTETTQSVTAGGITDSASMKRTMKCLFTEDAAYYYIDAEISESSSDGQSAYMNFVVEYFITKEEILIRYTELEVVINGQRQVTEALCDKWIGFTEELGAYAFTSVNDSNYAVMSVIGDCLEENKANLKGSNKVFTLDDEACKTLCLDLFMVSANLSMEDLGDIGLIEGLKSSSFNADLSDEKKPTMTLAYTLDCDDFLEEEGLNLEANDHLNIEISEINRGNKVQLPSGEKIYDFDEIEKLL